MSDSEAKPTAKPAPKPKGLVALDEELARYGAKSVTLRLCDALLKGLPDAPELEPWTSLDGCLAIEGVDEAVARRAIALADEDAVDRALFAAKSIDTGDTGITILTGVRTALSYWLGDKGPGAGADAQQRADAGLKALGVAYLATQLIPREPAQRVAILESLPAGRALILYYAAVEVALPFGPEVASGHFVADLVEQQSRKIAARLLGVIGRKGLSDAQDTLAALARRLDAAVVEVAPHADALADTMRKVLPRMIQGKADAMSDVVAAGADALPSYRFLAARLAAETRIGLARWEADPESEPQPLPEPESAVQGAPGASEGEVQAAPPPPAVPEFLAASALTVDPLHSHDPLTEPAAEAPEPEHPETVPDPPGEHDLSGVYQRAMPWGVVWLVFTRDGVFSNQPPADPEPDWVLHAEAGHQVGTYQHRDDQLEIRWPNGKSTTSVFAREPTAMTVDGQRCGRCDWNLDGHVFRGTWEARDGESWWTLRADGAFESSEGAGTYSLGVGAVRWTFEDGRERATTLYSSLEPDSGSPDCLWIGGEAFDRAVR